MRANISICEADFYFKELLIDCINKRINFNLNDYYTNGLELINRIYHKQNNFLIIDSFTPIMTGFEAIKILRQRDNQTPIITYSHVYQEDIHFVLEDINNVYYCQKNSDVIFEILTSIIERKTDFYADYLKKWTQNKADVHEYITRQRQNIYNPTSIELQIINHACQGLTNKEIGDKVNLSSRTVEKYMKKLSEKFMVKNKIQLITYCVEQNLHNYE
ncbi:LuxR C-terminal-related transcriptional regulator [Myroides sp. M-43]|uniref:response regulator transcription factor n=1 Tax=Myroides oncorhynchi TaxID=2893756 RepID=UPI001E447396|nr:LuxR C-terminal-related transcriptional regulator [Myroides oncorhynchi]MCC9043539.1 LuxR C-terminal-related transcriptional regulator [Myroides oncorhynchi]